MSALYEIKLDLDPEQKAFLNDAIKMTTIYFVGLCLHCNLHPSPNKVVEKYAIEIFCLFLLGLAFYHLVINLLVRFI